MNSELTRVLELWWAFAADASIQFACFALALALLDLLIARFAAPEVRAALWLAVLAKLLFPNASPAALRWSIPASIVPSVLEDSLHGNGETQPISAWLAPGAFALWLAGVALLASVGLVRYRRLRQGRLENSEPAPCSVRSLAGDVAARLGLSRPAAVRVFRGRGGPVVLGFLRPVVLIPRSLLSSGQREELELVLFHELAHIKRRDPLWSLLCISMQVLYWFHPLVWMARRRLALLRELACDQTVARALGGDTADYRRTILSLARPWVMGPDRIGLAFLTPRSQLAVRIRSLEGPISNNRALRRTSSALLFTLLFICCLPRAPKLTVPFPYPVPPLEDLEGCLRLRYAVLSMTAHAQTVEGSELAPLLLQSTERSLHKDSTQ